jgi:hypothetical protein
VELKEWLNQGTPLALLAVLVLALWKTAQWTKTNVVLPIVSSIVALITELRVQLPEQNRKLDGVADTAAAVAADQKHLLKEILKTLNSQTGVLKQSIDYQTAVIEDGKPLKTQAPAVPHIITPGTASP